MPTSILQGPRRTLHSKKGKIVVAASYVFDWAVIIALAVVGYILSGLTPNKRPFYLSDPNISFPLTVETVPNDLATILVSTIPVGIICVICLIFVPGSTVPKGTPSALVWQRRIWELHVGLLGLALAIGSSFFITNSMKNIFGKPRPDLLSRCIPDLENISRYIVGGNLIREGRATALVSADICTNTDAYLLDDGFRSFPSAHSSLSAASYIYLSLFIASKFAVVIPFLPHSSPAGGLEPSLSAFPSRLPPARAQTVISDYGSHEHSKNGPSAFHYGSPQRVALAARRQAAAPPVYLLVLSLLPFFASVFIASSRWPDFRHHGFDILFGYLIGVVTSIFSFRYYHLPISSGAGWAWAPRSPSRAFWAGVGYSSYAVHDVSYLRTPDEEEGIEMEESRSRSEGRRSRENMHGPF